MNGILTKGFWQKSKLMGVYHMVRGKCSQDSIRFDIALDGLERLSWDLVAWDMTPKLFPYLEGYHLSDPRSRISSLRILNYIVI
mmetsp:Transcript_7743/g.15643  ORF Transcript_7743/g.15643 Transcript_7743/m.15643 type:complete len:84 (-) Transcript_7743:315-566(-)